VGLNPFEGDIRFGGRVLRGLADMDREYRRAVRSFFSTPTRRSIRAKGSARSWPGRCGSTACRRAGRKRQAVKDLLEEVQLPADFAGRYPHQLSGGQKQRVAIARAFASRPQLVICDEITSSLDVSIQAQIIALLLSLRERFGTAYLFITHDLNLVRQIAHRVAVMYRGDLVEVSGVDALAQGRGEPYTRALLDAVPTPVG
jgi:peptide/nickel transport system ATP-binding protein